MLRRDLDSLQNSTFDVVIIGGGISGVCLAHDAALRGLSVALVERQDFGGATSAASSKVLHSGIRYLQQLKLDKVRESAIERGHFQAIAPHLTHYVPFLVPTYRGVARGQTALRAALALHTVLATGQDAGIRDSSKRVPRSRLCTKEETLALAPMLAGQPGLTGSCMLYESHMHSSERMTLAFLKSACRSGAVAANYVSAQRLLKAGDVVSGVLARDELTGESIEVRARLVANAAGPWITELNRQFGAAGPSKVITGFTKGAHLITRPLNNDVALVLPTTKQQHRVIDRGGRHLFVIPWRQRSLIGTSNVAFDRAPGDVHATTQDVIGLLADVNEALPGVGLTLDDVDHAFAGLYPLTAEQIRADVYQATGTYQVVDHGAIGDIEGVISVLGMKFTTARRLAELATDLILRKIGVKAQPSRTSTTPLVGGDIEHLPGFLSNAIHLHRDSVEAHTIRHLVDHYGTEIDAVLAAKAPGLRPTCRLSPHRESIEAEVAFGVTDEMAVHLDDIVFRRTGLGTLGHPGVASLRRCGEIMAGLLGWSTSRLDDEVNRTAALLTVEGLKLR